MTTIRVPKDVATSPQDGSGLILDTDARAFIDDSGNSFTPDELAASRPGNRIQKWIRENYPQWKGNTE